MGFLALPVPTFAIECSQLSKSTSIPSGYGTPYNFFTPQKELLLRVVCETSGEVFYVGSGGTNQYMYKDAYEWRNGWQKVTLSGSTPSGDWFIGSASVSLPPLPLGMPASSGGYVAAYVCQNVSDQWKCGCRDASCTQKYWQVQSFPKSTQQSVYQNQIEGDLAAQEELMIAYPSRYDGPPGTEITLMGSGFTPNNNVLHFEGGHSMTLSAVSSSRLVFRIPNSVPPGVYRIYVKNSKGTSNSNNFIAITTPGASPPTISSISPREAQYGGSITITGQNFAPTGNVIMMSHHVYMNVPSTQNGTKMTLELTDWPLAKPTPTGLPKMIWGEVVYIANKNGVTPKDSPGAFKLEL